MEEKEEVKKTEEKIYKLVEVPTQYGVGTQTPEGKIISSDELLVDISNRLTKIESAVS